MSTKKYLDEKTFSIAKMLLKAGATYEEISEHLGMSSSTVSRIKQAETLMEYKNICAARALAYKAKNAPKTAVKDLTKEEPVADPKPAMNPTVVRVEATHYMMEELRKLNETTELMSRKMTAALETLNKILESWN